MIKVFYVSGPNEAKQLEKLLNDGWRITTGFSVGAKAAIFLLKK